MRMYDPGLLFTRLSHPNGSARCPPTEGDQRAHTAVWDRWCHRFKADTEAGLGRDLFKVTNERGLAEAL